MYLDVKIYRLRVAFLPTAPRAWARWATRQITPDPDPEQRENHGERRQLWCQGHVGRQRQVLRDLPPGRGRRGRPRRRVAALQPQGAAGEPAPHRGRRGHHRRRHQGAGWLGRRRGPRQGDPVHAGARDHAGLHRRALRRRPGHHARGDGGPRRGPVADQPARAGRDGHRPLRDRRRLRHAGGVRAQRRDRVRAQPRALPVPALGPGRVRRLQGRPARHRHRPPGQHRAPRPRRVHPRARRRADGVPRHPGRHRLAHHDGQRHRRRRLGRRRHRGRGGHARPAGLHADPARGRLQAQQRPARGRHRDRPGADDHRDAARARRGRQVRGVLRSRRLRAAAGQPGHDRQHEPGVRVHDRGLPDRRGDHEVPQVHRPRRRADRPGRGLRQGAGSLARPRRRAALLRAARARPGRRWCPRSPVPSGRRTGSRCPTPRRPSAPRSPTTSTTVAPEGGSDKEGVPAQEKPDEAEHSKVDEAVRRVVPLERRAVALRGWQRRRGATRLAQPPGRQRRGTVRRTPPR